MSIREQQEEREYRLLNQYAQKSAESKGRMVKIDECDLRTIYQRDRDRIIHSKSFRRLMHKTQVFLSPEGDHYRTRLTHTLEVMQISRTIARALRLNEDLTEAIALGHDLGHTPFGHTGEDAMDRLIEGGFRHNEQSVRVVSRIENGGKGLNLTYEVIDGILNHRGGCNPATLEGQAVQISDKIAYINHDIDDAIRAGVMKQSDLPSDCLRILGETSTARIDMLVDAVVSKSFENDSVEMAEEAWNALRNLRKFLFETLYLSQLQQKERTKIKRMLSELYFYYLEYNDKLPVDFTAMINIGEEKSRVVCDYIAGMTDRFAIKNYTQLFLPASWDSF